MKVLMFGWEFPPHISGGLGTACFGMTQGLSSHGVEVAFVVPRAHGDEDERFVSVLGANEVALLEERVETAATPAAHDGPAAPTTRRKRVRRAVAMSQAAPEIDVKNEAWTRVSELMEVFAIDSPLTPYLTEREYGERLRQLSESGTSTTARTRPGASSAAIGPLALDEVLALSRRIAGVSQGFEREVSRHLVEGGRLDFSGGYGPDLMSEVARFALVASRVASMRIAAGHGFDVVHCHDWMTLPAGLAAARTAGKPLVFHVHACEYDRSGENVNARVRDIEQLGLDAATRVVCVSHYTAGILLRRYRVDAEKIRVVHNAVTQRQQADLLHVQKTIEEPIVLFLGRVTFQKGPDYFLEAAARVIQIEPRVKFVMSGSGDMLPVMIERAARLGIARHVHFTGFLKGEDVERMYAIADIYVMPSVSEPFGITPLEAMALDTPVIVSRQSGVSEVLRNALKVDFWDVDDIANKILALLRYPPLVEQLTLEGREEVQALRWEHPAAVLRDVYNELSGGLAR